MACRGVHFSINSETMNRVLGCDNDDDLISLIQEEIEAMWDEEWLCETDKAWDAIHRCLTDGKLGFENGTLPLRLCILGGKQLHEGDEYIVSLVLPDQVKSVADSLTKLTKDQFKSKYFSIDQNDYDGEISEDDFEYTWDWFSSLPTLFVNASREGRAILFTVDQ